MLLPPTSHYGQTAKAPRPFSQVGHNKHKLTFDSSLLMSIKAWIVVWFFSVIQSTPLVGPLNVGNKYFTSPSTKTATQDSSCSWPERLTRSRVSSLPPNLVETQTFPIA